MIAASGLEIRVGARTLISDANFRIAKGDKVGLVGRNGAGKTTLTKTLAGELEPFAGSITKSDSVGYLPQDPRTGDLEVSAMGRILSVRGLDEIVRRMRSAEEAMGGSDTTKAERGMRRYATAEAEFVTQGGYAA